MFYLIGLLLPIILIFISIKSADKSWSIIYNGKLVALFFLAVMILLCIKKINSNIEKKLHENFKESNKKLFYFLIFLFLLLPLGANVNYGFKSGATLSIGYDAGIYSFTSMYLCYIYWNLCKFMYVFEKR